MKLSPDGKVGLSISSDKTVKVWDINTHKILKNWEFHQDSVHSLFVNDNFTRILTGCKSGEIFLTDIARNCYCKIDRLNEPITSMVLTKNLEIMASTSRNKLYEYKFKNNKTSSKTKNNIQTINGNGNQGLNKTLINDKNNLLVYKTDFSNEIVKYHLMKNKIYIVYLTTNKRLIIFNILKSNKIAEYEASDYMTFEKLVELLDKFDLYTLKSWFSLDIKLGALNITFQNENFFSNVFNFDIDYLEKIIEKTNNFEKSINPSTFKFFINGEIGSQSPINSFSQTTSHQGSQTNVSNISSTMPNRKPISVIDKHTTCGALFIKSLFNDLITKSQKKYTEFLDNNFYDTRGYLKQKYLKINTSNKEKNTNYLENLSEQIKNYFIYSTVNDKLIPGPYLNEITINFELPSFIREIISIVRIIF